eukprot:5710482-Pyramimonas_sp.AAC.1
MYWYRARCSWLDRNFQADLPSVVMFAKNMRHSSSSPSSRSTSTPEPCASAAAASADWVPAHAEGV